MNQQLLSWGFVSKWFELFLNKFVYLKEMPCLKCSLIYLTLEKDFDIKQVMNKTSLYLVTELVGM